jgi:chromosome partitioning protein
MLLQSTGVSTIIAIGNQKGGAGKTTICMNLAGGFQETGYKVLVVDADPQGSAMNWRANGGETNQLGFDVIAMPNATLHKDLPNVSARSQYEVILIDCPPGGAHRSKADDITRSALLAAQVVVLPVQPSPLDYQAAITMVPLLRDTAIYKPDLRVFLLINRKVSSARIGRDARNAALKFFQDEALNIQILHTEIGSRTALAESAGVGKTILEYASGSIAALEIRQLTEEIITCLANPVPVAVS